MTPRDDDTAEDASAIAALVWAAHRASDERLVVATSGNASVRLAGDRIAISAARTWLGALEPVDVVVVDLNSGGGLPLASGDREPIRRPSRETPMHLAVYRAAPHVGSVLHFQSPAATVLACLEGPEPDLALIPEVPAYLRRPAWVGWEEPGSEALARAVAACVKNPEVRIVQLRNHGQVAIGPDPAAAVERAAFFELACRLWLDSTGAQRRVLDAVARDSLQRYG